MVTTTPTVPPPPTTAPPPPRPTPTAIMITNEWLAESHNALMKLNKQPPPTSPQPTLTLKENSVFRVKGLL